MKRKRHTPEQIIRKLRTAEQVSPEQAVCSTWLCFHPISSPATPQATQSI